MTAAADKGRANKAITKSLAAALNLKPAQIELISGQTNRRKVFAISDAPADLDNRVNALMASAPS